MIALTLLALVSIAGLQVMQLSQQSFSEGRSALGSQQKNQAIAAFINQDFKSKILVNSPEAITYVNDAMPADLRAGPGLKLATLFGTGSRFDQLVPKCVLVAPTDLIRNQIAFQADCHNVDGKTIASMINGVLRTGAKISFAIDGAGAKCSASSPIDSAGPGQTALLRVKDPACLSLSSAPGAPNVRLALSETIDIAAHRQHCRIE